MHSMLIPLLPSLHLLRMPLATGAVWLATFWLAWGRDLPGPKEATGLLADLYGAAEYLGIVAVFLALALAAFITGFVMAILYSVPAALLQLILQRWEFTEFVSIRIIISSKGIFSRVLFKEGRRHRELLRHLGIAYPERNAINHKIRKGLWEAIMADTIWLPVTLPESSPDLWARYEKANMGANFARYMALPIAALVSVFVTAAVPELNLVGSIAIAYVCWMLVRVFAVTLEMHVLRIKLDAMYLGKIEARNLTEYGIEVFGRADHAEANDTEMSKSQEERQVKI